MYDAACWFFVSTIAGRRTNSAALSRFEQL
jgi:hypothetical protein